MTEKYDEEWQANLYNSLKQGGPKGRHGGLGFGGGARAVVDPWDRSGEPPAAPENVTYQFAPGPKKAPPPAGAKKGFIMFQKAGTAPEPEPEETSKHVVFDSDEEASTSAEKKDKKKDKKKKEKREKKEKKEKKKEKKEKKRDKKKEKERKEKREKKEKKKDKKRKRAEREDSDSDAEQRENKKQKIEQQSSDSSE